MIYIVIKQFQARLEDELDLQVGDKIEVLSDDAEYHDGWYFGKNLLTGDVGLYPASFTTIFNSEESTLIRSRSRFQRNNTSPSINNVKNNEEKLSPSPLNKSQTSFIKPSDGSTFTKPSDTSVSSAQIPQMSTISNWSPTEVKNYFIQQNFEPATADIFENQKITGAILLELDLAHLKELEISSFGERFQINKTIEKLRQQNFEFSRTISTDSSVDSPPTATTTVITETPKEETPKEPVLTHTRQSSSIYDATSHKRKSSVQHKRHSSLFSFLSTEHNTPILPNEFDNKLASPKKEQYTDIDNTELSPRKPQPIRSKSIESPVQDDRRTASDSAANLSTQRPGAFRLKSLRTTSTQNFRNLTGSRKSKTSAFQEGIREVTPDEAIKSANYSGYMSKRSSNTLAWRTRYFCLHGTRLSYFTSLKDKKEKGLIDITAHKVIPINMEEAEKSDKYAAIYASTTFAGNFCFKLVPPAPGFKKGLTFTQPKTHYFAVESEDEMRGWIKALMTATIDIDDSVPVVSSCSTPTVSLLKAQELLAKAREENKLKDEELRAKGYLRGGEDFDISDEVPKLTIDTKRLSSPRTPQITKSASQTGGFASPYLLASGLLSPRSGNQSSPNESPSTSYVLNDF